MPENRNCDKNTNKQKCNCTYEPCSRKGKCCECVNYHWFSSRELPACFFPDEAEKTFDRSLDHFIRIWSKKTGK